MWILYLVIIAVAAYFWMEASRGSNALDAVKGGKFGPFKMSAVCTDGITYFAVDSESRRVALVNISTPGFAANGEFTEYYYNTFVVDAVDIKIIACNINPKSKLGVLTIVTNIPIPEPNKWKRLKMQASTGTKEFFERNAPWLPFQYNEKAEAD